MTPFDFVFALISIISSLALTQIITGVVAIIRHGERASFSLAHAIWIGIAFAVVIGNWGALWSARLEPDWPSYRVLAWVASMTSLYAFCALVVPEIERGTPLNLRAFHAREGSRYIIAHNSFALLAVVLVVTISGITPESLRNLVPASVALALGIAALLTKGAWQLTASILVAIVATAFMLANINLVAR